jgi:hypothetical protein
MSLLGVMSSPSQKRSFLLASILIIVISCILVWVLYYFTSDTRGWNLLISVPQPSAVARITLARHTCFCGAQLGQRTHRFGR